MTLTRLIPERHRALAKEVLTFGTVGAINTAFGQIIFNILLGLGALTASTISTIIATFVSYVLNRHVTYRHRPRTPLRRELPMFVGFNLVGLGLQLGVLSLGRWAFHIDGTDRLGLNIVRFGGVAVGTVFLLMTYRTFVFRTEKVPAVETGVVTQATADAPASAATPAPARASVAASVPAQGGEVDSSDEFDELMQPLEAELAEQTPAGNGEPAVTAAL